MATIISVIIGGAVSYVTLAKIVGWYTLLSAYCLWIAWAILFAVITIGVRTILAPPKKQERKQKPREFKTYKFKERIVEKPAGNNMVELQSVIESVEENKSCTTYQATRRGRIC